MTARKTPTDGDDFKSRDRNEVFSDLGEHHHQRPAEVQQRTSGWGISVEDRKYGLPRIDELREALAAVRFLSVEPFTAGSST